MVTDILFSLTLHTDIRPALSGTVLYLVEGAPNSAVRVISLSTHTVSTVCDRSYVPERECQIPGKFCCLVEPIYKVKGW